MDFPRGKTLFHLILNPGTAPSAESVTIETGINYEKRVNGHEIPFETFQPGKRAYLLSFSTFSGNFPVGRTDETFSIYCRTEISGNFD